MENLSSVSIVIPVFNSSKLVRENLSAVFQSLKAYPSGGEVVVLSAEPPSLGVATLISEFPSLVSFGCHDNDEFDKVVSAGLEIALYDTLIFLDPEMRPELGFISPLVRRLKQEGVFCVQSAVADERQNIDPYCLGRSVLSLGVLKRIPTKDLGEEGWLSLYPYGRSLAFSRSSANHLVLWSKASNIWGNQDFGLRAWRRGWEIWLEPKSLVFFQGKASRNDAIKSRRIRASQQRNGLLFEWTHLSLLTLIVFCLPTTLYRLIVRLLAGDLGYILIVMEALSLVPEVRNARHEIKRNAALSFASVLTIIKDENEQHTELDRKRVTGCCNV